MNKRQTRDSNDQARKSSMRASKQQMMYMALGGLSTSYDVGTTQMMQTMANLNEDID